MPKAFKTIIYLTLSLLFVGLMFFVWTGPPATETAPTLPSPSNHRAEPNTLEFYETAFSFPKTKMPFQSGVVAGIVPHHLLAADMIAEFYHNLAALPIDTVILIGPNHFLAGQAELISSNLSWQTPYGRLDCDGEVLNDLQEQGSGLNLEPKVISNDHAMTSQAAFIKRNWPQAKLVPLLLHPNFDAAQAKALAQSLVDIGANKNILVIASADFAHYMASEAAIAADQKSIAAINSFDFDQVYLLAVDSPPSLYTVMQVAAKQQTGFQLLKNSNSALLSGQPDLKEVTSYITGYFAFDPKPAAAPRGDVEINMLFAGDLMLDRYVKDRIDKYGLDYLFAKVDPEFWQGLDLFSVNLEGAVTEAGQHYEPVKAYDFAFAPEIVAGLKKYNINFFNLANNHIDDQGLKGIEQTRKNLDELEFSYAGCPNGIISDCSTKVMTVNDIKIGMVGLSTLWSRPDPDKLRKMMDDVNEQSDYVVVNVHWGEEYETKSNKLQQELGRQLIDLGADLIIGHHPHVVQETEIYKDKYIYYSLGNFIFDQYFAEATQKGLLVKVVIKKHELTTESIVFRSKSSQIETSGPN